MSSKKRVFLISNSIVIAFTTLLVLAIAFYWAVFFGLEEEHFIYVALFLTIFSVTINLILTKPLLEPLFRSEDNLEKKVKETLHELNIPASTIQINASMLEKNIHDEKNKKRIQRIKEATYELLNLYNQMEYEIKKEIDKIDYQEFCLNKMLKNSVNKFDDIKQNVQIKLDVPEVYLYTDKNGFQKVLDNLLSNAIKYNEVEGVVEIEYKKSVLSIYNSGKTIDAENIFRIFEQYYQVDFQKKGFGLGLHMVKEFCDHHLIEIKIDSNEKGTTIFLNLMNILKNK